MSELIFLILLTTFGGTGSLSSPSWWNNRYYDRQQPLSFYPPDSFNTRFVGNWPFGYGTAITVDPARRIAYVTSGGGVLLLDVSNPARPIKLSDIRTRGGGVTVDFHNNILFLIYGGVCYGTEVWDVSNLRQPLKLCAIPSRPSALKVQDHYLYLGVQPWPTPSTLKIYDIQNPANPVEIGSWSGADIVQIETVDSFAIVKVNEPDTGFRILNIRNPANPFEVGSWDSLYIYGMVVKDDLVYCSTTRGLRIVDISEPSQPREIGFCPSVLEGALAVADSFAYIVHDTAGLIVINVSNPRNPFFVTRLRAPGLPVLLTGDISLLDTVAFIARGNANPGLWIVNIKNRVAPYEIGCYQLSGWATSLAIQNNYAFLGDWDLGLRILDVSNPANPDELAFFPAIADGIGAIAVQDTFAYLGDYTAGLIVLNIKDPANPRQVGFWQLLSGSMAGIAVRDSYAYVAAGNFGVRIISISDPSNPYEVGFCPSNYARAVAVQESLAYVADEGFGLRIINIKNPSQPYQVGALSPANHPVQVALKDSLVFLTSYREGGLLIVNAANPAAPRELARHPGFRGCSWGVAVERHFVYFTDLCGFIILDITEPANPVLAGYNYLSPNCPYELVLSPPYVYFAAGTCGLQIYKSLLAGIKEETGGELGRSPARATIVDGVLTVPEAPNSRRDASWVLVNVSGRRVLELVPGTNDVRHLAPGVYFIHTAGSSETKRVMIVR